MKQDGDFHWSLIICIEQSLINSQKKYIADCLSQYQFNQKFNSRLSRAKIKSLNLQNLVPNQVLLDSILNLYHSLIHK